MEDEQTKLANELKNVLNEIEEIIEGIIKGKGPRKFYLLLAVNEKFIELGANTDKHEIVFNLEKIKSQHILTSMRND